MKVAAKVMVLFEDSEGFGLAIFQSLQLNPNFHAKKEEVELELSLDKYGIKDSKACGKLVHFVDGEGLYQNEGFRTWLLPWFAILSLNGKNELSTEKDWFGKARLLSSFERSQVSVLLLRNYERPVVACVVNEVLTSINEDNPSMIPTLILPYFVQASKLNFEMISPAGGNRKFSLYGANVGPTTDFSLAMVEETQKLPPSLQIHYEPLACLLHLARVLNLPTILLIAPRGEHRSKETKEEVLEALHEMIEFLARNAGLSFMRDRVHLNMTEKTKVSQEPWRALYG